MWFYDIKYENTGLSIMSTPLYNVNIMKNVRILEKFKPIHDSIDLDRMNTVYLEYTYELNIDKM